MLCLTVFFLILVIYSIIICDEPHFVCPLIGCLIFAVISAYSHSHDLSIVRFSEELIKVQQESIDEVDRQMKNLSDSVPNVSLVNADSPLKSLIELRGERIKSMAHVKNEINKAKISILQRKIGLNRDIVWLLGDK